MTIADTKTVLIELMYSPEYLNKEALGYCAKEFPYTTLKYASEYLIKETLDYCATLNSYK